MSGSFAVAADAPAPKKMTALGDWLRMLPDGTVEMYTDKVEVGMGVPTGFAQFVADELDVPFDHVRPMLGDTSETVSAGGVGGSFSTFAGNFAIRNAAAEMRSILVTAAAQRLGVPTSQLSVHNGVITVTAIPRSRCATATCSARSRPIRSFRKPVMPFSPASRCRRSPKRGKTTKSRAHRCPAKMPDRKRSAVIPTS